MRKSHLVFIQTGFERQLCFGYRWNVPPATVPAILGSVQFLTVSVPTPHFLLLVSLCAKLLSNEAFNVLSAYLPQVVGFTVLKREEVLVGACWPGDLIAVHSVHVVADCGIANVHTILSSVCVDVLHEEICVLEHKRGVLVHEIAAPRHENPGCPVPEGQGRVMSLLLE